jgi:hypothetical protein
MEGMENPHGAVIKKETSENSDASFKSVFERNAYNIVQGAIDEVLKERDLTREMVTIGEEITPRILKNLFPTNQRRREDEELITIVKKVINGEISEKDTISYDTERKKELKKLENEKNRRGAYAHEKALGGD